MMLVALLITVVTVVVTMVVLSIRRVLVISTELAVETLVRAVAVGVVVILATVLLVIEIATMLGCVALGLLTIDEVSTLCLSQAVNFPTGEGTDALFGELRDDVSTLSFSRRVANRRWYLPRG